MKIYSHQSRNGGRQAPSESRSDYSPRVNSFGQWKIILKFPAHKNDTSWHLTAVALVAFPIAHSGWFETPKDETPLTVQGANEPVERAGAEKKKVDGMGWSSILLTGFGWQCLIWSQRGEYNRMISKNLQEGTKWHGFWFIHNALSRNDSDHNRIPHAMLSDWVHFSMKKQEARNPQLRQMICCSLLQMIRC